MRVGVWHWSRKPFNGTTVRVEPSGGTETAIAYTCEALARAGHEVTVYCRTPSDVDVEGVAYRSAEGLAAKVRDETFDAFVVVRHLAALTVPVRTRAVLYWSHDNLDQPFLHGMFRWFEGDGGERRMLSCFGLGKLVKPEGPVDAVLAVSRWQARAIQEQLGVPASRVEVIGNGLQPGLFDPEVELGSRPPIVLYTLPPDRGLLPLLEIFARVKARVLDAELHVYSRSTIYGASLEEDEATYGELYELLRRFPGTHHHDPVDQRTLAAVMSRAMVYAYPSDTAETFCISILEAQAAGLVPVSSATGAIPERITAGIDGFLIAGDPTTHDYQVSFARRVVDLLNDRDLRRAMATAARARAHSEDYSYDAVAARLLARIESVAEDAPSVRRFDPSEAPRYARGSRGHDLDGEQLEHLRASFAELLHLGGAS